MIDRIRHDIQQRLEQLLAEADKLRHALAGARPPRALNPQSENDEIAAAREAGSEDAGRCETDAGATRTPTAGAANGASASTRTPPGQTKTRVLAALSSDQALTAGEVATATGLARPTVSTTLSKLSKTGEVVKAERGYRLPSADGGTASASEPAATRTTADA